MVTNRNDVDMATGTGISIGWISIKLQADGSLLIRSRSPGLKSGIKVQNERGDPWSRQSRGDHRSRGGQQTTAHLIDGQDSGGDHKGLGLRV